jgi:hypothetical protein
MGYNDRWFERNEGFISFLGHIAAIEQRSAMIQELANSSALQRRNLRAQERRAASERDDRRRRDILYDINQAVTLIQAHYNDRPDQALYESYLLKHTVDEIGLHHSWFSDLEWKHQCTETLNRILQIINTAFGQLPPQQIEDINRRFEEALAAKRTENELLNRQLLARNHQVPCIGCGMAMFQEVASRRKGICFKCAKLGKCSKAMGRPWLALLIICFIVYLVARFILK